MSLNLGVDKKNVIIIALQDHVASLENRIEEIRVYPHGVCIPQGIFTFGVLIQGIEIKGGGRLRFSYLALARFRCRPLMRFDRNGFATRLFANPDLPRSALFSHEENSLFRGKALSLRAVLPAAFQAFCQRVIRMAATTPYKIIESSGIFGYTDLMYNWPHSETIWGGGVCGNILHFVLVEGLNSWV